MNALHKYAAKRLLVERLLQKLSGDMRIDPLKVTGAPATQQPEPPPPATLPPPKRRTAAETARMGLLKKKKQTAVMSPAPVPRVAVTK